MDAQTKQMLTRKEREANVNKILNSLDIEEHTFNTIILGFTDIIQSSFYNYLKSQCKSQNELKKMHDRINNEVNEVVEKLNDNSLSNPEDMVILTTVMIECINRALIRQKDNGTIKTTL